MQVKLNTSRIFVSVFVTPGPNVVVEQEVKQHNVINQLNEDHVNVGYIFFYGLCVFSSFPIYPNRSFVVPRCHVGW